MALTSPRDQLTNSIVKTVKIYRALSEVFSSPGKFLPDDNENKGHLVNFYQGLSEKIAKGGKFLPPIVV